MSYGHCIQLGSGVVNTYNARFLYRFFQEPIWRFGHPFQTLLSTRGDCSLPAVSSAALTMRRSE
jgi:hypothetical protein